MDKKKIIIIIVSIIALIASSLILVLSFNKEEAKKFPDSTTPVENQELLQDHTIGDLLISDVLLYSIGETSQYTAIVTNKSKKDTTATLYITFYENDNKTEVIALYNKKIASGEQKNIDISFESDMTKITKIEYTLK